MRKDNETRREMIECPECNCILCQDNLVRHLARVHPGRVPGPDPGSYVIPRSNNRVGRGEIARSRRESMRDFRRGKGMRTTSERKQKLATRERMLKLAKRRKQRLSLLVGTTLTILFFGLLFGYRGMFREGDREAATQVVETGTGDISIPRSELSHDARFYSFNSTGTDVRFFGVVGSDGDERFAFDACDACYPQKKGYPQNSGNMKCHNCGREFPITGLGKDNQEGGCWPSYLPFSEDGDDIIIMQDDLAEKRYMFE